MHKCIDCRKKIDKRAKRCYSCENKRRHKMGIFKERKRYYCIDCKIEISYNTFHYGKKRCNICKNLDENNPNYIDGRSLKNNYCLDCGKEIDWKAKFCKSCSQLGERNHRFIDGSSGEYPVEFNDKLKESIRKRDNYECQNCGMTEEEHLIVWGQVLHVHHIDYIKQNINKDNLISLCFSCNIRANSNRDYWQELYTKKILERAQ